MDDVKGLLVPTVMAASYPQPWQQLQDRSPRLEWENFAQD
jgi:hypothetical protein